ncbi:MAG: discoidin domain-containing protein [Deltaproteobacteria bacterium]|nr:discoidin domain-containing protein [Deltaproteobacteria bacterium]
MRGRFYRAIFVAAAGTVALALTATATVAHAQPIFVDSGDDASAWNVVASPGAAISLGRERGAVRADFDLGRGRAHVLIRRDVSIDLPADYMFVLRLRGLCAPNTVEFKLISGENVWWRRFADHEFAVDGQDLRISRSRVEFAWGPSGAAAGLHHIDAIEIAVVAGQGGDGTLWVDELRLDERADGGVAAPPSVSASSSASGTTPAAVLDANSDTLWRSAATDSRPWLLLDFHYLYEHGGFIVEQDQRDYARAYVVEASADARTWAPVARFTRSNGGRDYVYLPDVFARYVRLRFNAGARGVAVRELRVQPFEFSSSLNQFFAAIAADAAPGLYPRYFAREQSYWTVVGAPDGDGEALLNEEGMLETGAGSFSIEPFLWSDGRLLGWKQGRHTPSLEDGELPIPTVLREHRAISLAVTAFVDDHDGESTLYARYRVTNTGPAPLRSTLFLALRPFQVLPPWQALNMVGGVARVASMKIEAAARSGGRQQIRVDDRRVVAVTPWSRFGASAFEQGEVSSFLAAGDVPPATSVHDEFARASGALAYDLQLEVGARRDVWVAVPMDENARVPEASAAVRGDSAAHPRVTPARRVAPAGAVAATASAAEQRFENAREQWRSLVARVGIELPPAAGDLVDSLRSNLAYVLVNRDRPAIQPGSRTYARSWIRDGALTSAALLELGFYDEAREFLRWYGGYQREDGWVPCCVDRRGADPVPEHDSFGEFIWGVAEVYRHTGDAAFAREMWPHVAAAAECMQRLRAKRMTPQYREPTRAAFYGLLPESISHEGYSARPVHSYWDDIFALRGFADAAMLAGVAADAQREARFGAEAKSFRATLQASVAATMRSNRLDTIPASAELADFDPTSTAIAFVLGLEDVYPAGALARTFDRYSADVRARAASVASGAGYTAYEMRNVPALTLLGRKREAIEVLGAMVADQRPPQWNQWPEISWMQPTEPSFLGDLPHSWIGSTFLHATRTLLVHERAADGSLVLGAGVPLTWLERDQSAAPDAAAPVVAVRGLSTHYGSLSYRMRRQGDRWVVVDIEAGIRVPPGGVMVAAPFGKAVRAATIDAHRVPAGNGEVRVRTLPARVEFEYRQSTPATRWWTH